MKIIDCIRKAVKGGYLQEPFNGFQAHQTIRHLSNCNYPLETIQNFLPKHRKGNPSKDVTEYFIRVSTNPALYKLI